MSSPGIGLQHLEKEYFIFSFLPSNSINFSPDTIDSDSESDFPMSNSISVFFDLVLTSLRWSRYSFIFIGLKVPSAIS